MDRSRATILHKEERMIQVKVYKEERMIQVKVYKEERMIQVKVYLSPVGITLCSIVLELIDSEGAGGCVAQPVQPPPPRVNGQSCGGTAASMAGGKPLPVEHLAVDCRVTHPEQKPVTCIYKVRMSQVCVI